jgi:hypothetical protein
MRDFIQATEYDAHMHAKFEDLTLSRFLQINSSSFEFLEFSMEQQCTNITLVMLIE